MMNDSYELQQPFCTVNLHVKSEIKRDGVQCVITLASGKVSLKKVGSQDKRVKKVLAVQRCVTITALHNIMRKEK